MNLFSNWHFMRIVRALIAIWAVFEFVNTKEWTVLFIGGFFAVQAIFHVAFNAHRSGAYRNMGCF